mmetsp:Transcript_75898/g.197461  ORF Transcript_75898/g.197461 Transcript_75898/m.197461 type:complete len:81 (-) Transcript_75898:116-358(-)
MHMPEAGPKQLIEPLGEPVSSWQRRTTLRAGAADKAPPPGAGLHVIVAGAISGCAAAVAEASPSPPPRALVEPPPGKVAE